MARSPRRIWLARLRRITLCVERVAADVERCGWAVLRGLVPWLVLLSALGMVPWVTLAPAIGGHLWTAIQKRRALPP